MINSLIPLEELTRLQFDVSLNGSQGQNRELARPCLIPAKNDIEAIECWLSEYKKRPTTYRNYRKDAERLLLWAIVARQKPLSSLHADDLLFYSQFLEDPEPRETWCGPKLARNGKRWSSGWRPFVGPLSKTAKVATFRNLASLFNYLLEVQYLTHNPMLPVRRQLKHSYSLEGEKHRVQKRMIDMDEWFAIQDALELMPQTKVEERWEKVRLRFLLALGYFAALRNHELATHSMAAFRKVHDWQTGQDRWWLHVMGKGGKLNEVPVNQSLLQALIEYRRFLKLPDEPAPDEQEPLIKSLITGKAITSRRINQLIKELTAKAAAHFENTHPEKAARLKKFSAHWLRHLSCSAQGLVDIRKENIKENARHENESTTAIYLHAFDHLRHQEMEKLTWRPELISPLQSPSLSKKEGLAEVAG